MKPTVLLVDLERGQVVRYVAGHAVQRFDVVDRQGFNRSFTRSQAESLHIGVHIKAEAEQA
jgi:hypothetical protein